MLLDPSTREDEPSLSCKQTLDDFSVYHLHEADVARHQEYQRLRADVFISRLGWNIPLDPQGLEQDVYDQASYTTTYSVYIKENEQEHLCGGVRLLSLRTWDDSMIPHAFATMIPSNVIKELELLDPQSLLEITRLCTQRHRRSLYSRRRAHDLVLAGAFACAEQTQRFLAVGVATDSYLRIARRSQFVFRILYCSAEFALIIIDLKATLLRMQASGNHERYRTLISLCQSPATWLSS